MYDVIIIGMGIGGITAGIYGKRAGLNVLMFEKSAPGGMLQKIDKIQNYLYSQNFLVEIQNYLCPLFY